MSDREDKKPPENAKEGGKTKGPLVCSFCGRDETQVDGLISGHDAYICTDCIEACYEIFEQSMLHATQSDGPWDLSSDDVQQRVPTPMEMKAALDDYVIGQDQAKKVLAVAVYNHYKRVMADLAQKQQQEQANKSKGKQAQESDGKPEDQSETVELTKSNILLIGPTGSGKTLLAQTLARLLNVPFAIADATALTEAGYVGEDVENILLKLIQNADGQIERAERGIIYIDEIDKITRRSDNPSITRDVSGEGVQQALLKILESTVANVPPQGGRKHPNQEFIQIDTTHILFICGGAFDGLEKVIRDRLGKKSIGFGANILDEADQAKDLFSLIEPQDLLKFGLIPEFVGRVPVTVSLQELDEEALIRILKEPKNALLKQYHYLLKLDGVRLEFEDEAIALIAKKALARKTGARGLRAVIEGIMLDVMFELPSLEGVERCVVTKACIESGAKPVLEYRSA